LLRNSTTYAWDWYCYQVDYRALLKPSYLCYVTQGGQGKQVMELQGRITNILTKRSNQIKCCLMEQHTLKIVNNHLNMNISSFFETFGGQSFPLYFNVVHFFNTSVNQTSAAA